MFLYWFLLVDQLITCQLTSDNKSTGIDLPKSLPFNFSTYSHEGDSLSLDKLLPYQINNFHESKSSHQSDRSLYSVLHVQEIGEKLDKIPPCQKACAKGLQNAIKLIIKSMNHVERYKELCKNYNDTYACIAEEKKCGEEESFFETFTSGLKYMCVDQALAFNITIECIDAHASVVQSECETMCSTRNVFLNWIMRSSIAPGIHDGILSSLSGGTRQGSLIDGDKVLLGERGSVINSHDDAANQMDYFRQLSSDLCMVSDCFLGCLRTKFNTRCDGSAGTLLSEVLVRPIASSQEKMSLFSPVLGVIVPEPCTFLYSGSDLAKHRIDPSMDQELKRMYSEKMAERVAEETTTFVAAIDPFSIYDDIPSPIDGTFDINDLIEKYYTNGSLSDDLVANGSIKYTNSKMDAETFLKISTIEQTNTNSHNWNTGGKIVFRKVLSSMENIRFKIGPNSTGTLDCHIVRH